LPNWPKKYEMPGEKSKHALHASQEGTIISGHW
jgi:hypothetical protein